jgi:hypothetical protein
MTIPQHVTSKSAPAATLRQTKAVKLQHPLLVMVCSLAEELVAAAQAQDAAQVAQAAAEVARADAAALARRLAAAEELLGEV